LFRPQKKGEVCSIPVGKERRSLLSFFVCEKKRKTALPEAPGGKTRRSGGKIKGGKSIVQTMASVENKNP